MSNETAIVKQEDLKPLPEVSQSLEPAKPQNPYEGIALKAFARQSQELLQAPVDPQDVEIRPDGIIYLPEIKYRRVLNKAFGAGAWALMPRGDFSIQENTLSREYALFVHGRFVSEARGEQDYIPNNPVMSYATCTEGVKSNALMRCCKDLGVASELWDPGFIAGWKKEFAVQVWRTSGRGKPPQWRRKDREPFYDETAIVEVKSKNAEVRTSSISPQTSDLDKDPFGPGLSEIPEPPNAWQKSNEFEKKKAELKEIMALPCFNDDQRTVMADNAAKCKTLEGVTKLVSKAMEHARKNTKAQAKADKEAQLKITEEDGYAEHTV